MIALHVSILQSPILFTCVEAYAVMPNGWGPRNGTVDSQEVLSGASYVFTFIGGQFATALSLRAEDAESELTGFPVFSPKADMQLNIDRIVAEIAMINLRKDGEPWQQQCCEYEAFEVAINFTRQSALLALDDAATSLLCALRGLQGLGEGKNTCSHTSIGWAQELRGQLVQTRFFTNCLDGQNLRPQMCLCCRWRVPGLGDARGILTSHLGTVEDIVRAAQKPLHVPTAAKSYVALAIDPAVAWARQLGHAAKNLGVQRWVLMEAQKVAGNNLQLPQLYHDGRACCGVQHTLDRLVRDAHLRNHQKEVRVVELGTFRGSTALYLLQRYHWIHWTSVDAGFWNPKILALVKLQFGAMGSRAKFIQMTTQEALSKVPDRSADIVFLDASFNADRFAEDIRAYAVKLRHHGVFFSRWGEGFGLLLDRRPLRRQKDLPSVDLLHFGSGDDGIAYWWRPSDQVMPVRTV